jgi:putative ubiquitin-RnfH superfamily antitoxin RatB of RatAB toxin-antitoxin module
VNVEVCYAEPDRVTRTVLDLTQGATVAEAVRASGIVERLGLAAASLTCAVFGRRAEPDTVLEEGDRVELLRPLAVDPKQARRLRAEAKNRAR